MKGCIKIAKTRNKVNKYQEKEAETLFAQIQSPAANVSEAYQEEIQLKKFLSKLSLVSQQLQVDSFKNRVFLYPIITSVHNFLRLRLEKDQLN